MTSPFNSTNITLVVDVSKWVQSADVALLKKNGVRGIIARIGEGLNNDCDPMWPYYVQAAYDNDIPCMGYYVHHPEYIDNVPGNVDAHLSRIKKFVANKAIRGIWIDAEITKDLNGNQLASNWISERTRSLLDETQRAFPDLIVGLYTGGWYVDSYSPQMKNWIYKYPLWWAYYTTPTGGLQIEWEQLASYYPYKLPVNLPPDATGNGAAIMNIWQWSGDHFKLPGMWSDPNKVNRAACDLNFAMMPEQGWHEWLDYTPRGVTPPADPPTDPETPTDPGTPVTVDLTETNKLLSQILAELKTANAAKWTITKA